MLAGDFHNAANPADVDGSGFVSLADTLEVVTDLRNFGAPHDLAANPPNTSEPRFYDVVGDDGLVTIADLIATVLPQRDGLEAPTPVLAAALDDPGPEGETSNPRIVGQVASAVGGNARLVGRIDGGAWFRVDELDAQGRFSFLAPLPIDGSADGSHTLELVVQNFGGPFDMASVPFVLHSFAPGIASISPAEGEEMVSVTRETIVRFEDRVNPATVTADSFYLLANGERVPGEVRVSSTGEFATFFYNQPLPPSTEVRVVVDGQQIRFEDGRRLDGDGDTRPGGAAESDFRTLPLSRIPGTNVWGFLKDAYTGAPIVGATIRVDGFPEANAVTDANGRYDLLDMPAPMFFVHIDGTTATSAPAGFAYPNVGKPFPSVPGQTIQMGMNGVPMDLFLPPMALSDVTPLSDTEPTEVSFGAAGLAELADMFPEVDPVVWQRTHVMIEPGAATDDQGNAATQAIVIPVPPDRLPGPLPPSMDPKLVISIQPLGATNFDVPAPVTFPNLDGLAPGEQSLIFSFNHDSGQWEVAGTGTVTPDGLMVASDPGVGIRAPGWHFTAVGTRADGSSCNEDEDLDPTPPKLEVEDRDDKPGDKILFFRSEGESFDIQIRNGGGMVLHVPTPMLSGDAAGYFQVEGSDSCSESGGSITVEALEPPNWDSLTGPAFYSTTLTISSDGGSENITLARLLDAGDTDEDGAEFEFNTTTVGVTRTVSVDLLGSAGNVTWSGVAAPFGVSGGDLQFAPTAAGAASGVARILVDGKDVGSIQLSGTGVDIQKFHLNRSDFIAAYQDVLSAPAASVDPQLLAIFPTAATRAADLSAFFNDVLAQSRALLSAGGLSSGVVLDDASSGTGVVADYHNGDGSGFLFGGPIFGQGTLDFGSLSFFALVAQRSFRTEGQTLFRFAELFNNEPSDGTHDNFLITHNTVLSAGASVAANRARLIVELADTLVHEFMHNVGSHHITGGNLPVDPFDATAAKIGKIGLHLSSTVADRQDVFTFYKGQGFFTDILPDPVDGPIEGETPPEGARPVVAVNGDVLLDGVVVDFGPVAVDGPNGAAGLQPMTISNAGMADLVLSEWTLTGPFTVAETLSEVTLAVGESLTLNVTFDPTVVGAAHGTLQFETNDPLQPTVLAAIRGVGQSSAGNLDVEAASLNFGGAVVGGGQVVRPVTLRNDGLQPLTIASLTIGRGDTSYRLAGAPALPLVLNPGEGRVLDVAFRPDATGLAAGSLVVGSDDPDAATTAIPLVGTGLNPAGDPGDFTGAYIAVEMESGLILRDRLRSSGEFGFTLPANQRFSLVLFDAASGLVSHSNLSTGASGSQLDLGALFFRPSTQSDDDGDGLPADAELAIGTSAVNADTDADGIDDDAEIAQGLDPLDDRGFPTGIVASLGLRGDARAVAVEGLTSDARRQTAYLATGSYGLAIVDASRFSNPVVLGQLDLPGDNVDVAVDPRLQIAAVAAGTNGLHLVDVADPMVPRLLRTLPVHADQVEAFEGLAYVATDTEVRAFDLLTGEALGRVALPGSGDVTGLARERDRLYGFRSGSDTFFIVEAGTEPILLGQLAVGVSAFEVGVTAGNGVAYVAGSGMHTIDVSNPAAPQLLGDAQNFLAREVALNGSGLALIAAEGQGLSIYDVRDPANTNAFVTRIDTPGFVEHVAVGAGIAFVADGAAGLQIINYLPFDSGGQAPQVSVSSLATDQDPNAPGVQVVEGASVPIRVDVDDDVQVRNVELLVDGQVVGNDVSFPFDFSAIAVGDDPNAATVAVQARATDTGGNVTLSPPLVLDLVPDTFAPTLESVTPADGAIRGQGSRVVRLRFSEPMDAQTLTSANLRLVPLGGGAADVTPRNVQLRRNDREVQLTYDTLVPGQYQVILQSSNVTDRAGNPLNGGGVVSTFEVRRSNAAADFEFQGSLEDSNGGAALTAVGQQGEFVEDTVFGATQQVYQFSVNTGLELATDELIPRDEYSVELIFLFDNDNGYRKILDFENQTLDSGFYVLSSRLNFYPVITGGNAPEGQYLHVVLTRTAATKEVIAYVNGVEAFRFTDTGDLAVVDNPNATLRFFIDDNRTGGEESSGRVARLRVYDEALSAEDVALLVPTS